MDTPLDECLERNRQRSLRIPGHVISNMSLEPPDPKKAPWEQGSIRLHAHACNAASSLVLQLIETEASHVVAPPPPPVDPELLEHERRKTRESVLHQYDGYLRSWVGIVARIRRSDTTRANQARKDILQKLKKREDSTVDPTLVMEWFLKEMDWTEEETCPLKTAMQSTL
jgi:tRNA uridine 5-carbamoylmethylation protein Kti12